MQELADARAKLDDMHARVSSCEVRGGRGRFGSPSVRSQAHDRRTESTSMLSRSLTALFTAPSLAARRVMAL